MRIFPGLNDDVGLPPLALANIGWQPLATNTAAPPRFIQNALARVGSLRAMAHVRRIGLLHLLLAAAVMLAMLAAFLLPVWARSDEASHYDLVNQYAHGVPAVATQTPIRPETFEVSQWTGVYRWRDFLEPAPALVWTAHPTKLPAPADELWWWRHVWQYSNEAAQPPVYYTAAVPVWWVGFGVGGPLGAVFALRVVNALLVAVLVLLTVRLGLGIGAGNRFVALTAGLVVAALPGLLVTGTPVTNDTLAAVFAASALVLATRMTTTPTVKHAMICGALLAAASLTKFTAGAIAPGLLIAPLLARDVGRGTRLKLVAFVAAPGVSLGAAWLIVHHLVFGGSAQLGLGRFGPPPSSVASVLDSLAANIFTFWGGEALLLSNLRDLPLLALVFCLALPALIGIIKWARQAPSGARSVLIVCGIATASQFLITAPVAIALNAGWFPGRFLYPALAAFVPLIVVGLWVELRGRLRRRAAVAAYLLCAAIALIPTLGSAAARPSLSASVTRPDSHAVDLHIAGSGWANGLRVEVTRVLADAPDQRLWLWVSVTNLSSSPVEWAPAEVTAATTAADLGTASYPESFKFTERLYPDRHQEGWIAVNARALSSWPSQLLPMVVTFPDVASIGDYAHGADLMLRVSRNSSPAWWVGPLSGNRQR